MARALIRLGRPCIVRHISLVSFNNRAVQTNCSETCYISSKSWNFRLFRNANLFSLECRVKIYKRMKLIPSSDQYLKLIDLKFPKFDLILPFYSGIANKLFRNESYTIRKYNIVAFQNYFSYFHSSFSSSSSDSTSL